jgi:hypothetical protein
VLRRGWTMTALGRHMSDKFNDLGTHIQIDPDAALFRVNYSAEQMTALRLGNRALIAERERDELRAEVERLRAVLGEYVTGCHACLGTGTQPGLVGQPGTYGHPCTECAPARQALSGCKT